jgi:hypothetical protein
MKTKIFNLNTTICDSVRLVDPFPVEWSPYINMTNSKTFSGSNVIQDLAEFLCTIGEADLDAFKKCYGECYGDIENDIENDIEKKRQSTAT